MTIATARLGDKTAQIDIPKGTPSDDWMGIAYKALDVDPNGIEKYGVVISFDAETQTFDATSRHEMPWYMTQIAEHCAQREAELIKDIIGRVENED